MMKQREIVEPELAGRVFKQGAKVSIGGAKRRLRFEMIDQAGKGHNRRSAVERQRPGPGNGSGIHKHGSSRASEIIAQITAKLVSPNSWHSRKRR